MADVLKYGWAYGGREGVEMPVSNDQYFHRLGGAFVCASGPEGVKISTASTDTLLGWAEVPRADSPGLVDYWKSSSTAAKDKVYVITDPTAVFSMPVFENQASLNASLVGYFVAASAEGATTTLKQKCRGVPAAAANKQLEVVDVDITNKVVYVRMNPVQRG